MLVQLRVPGRRETTDLPPPVVVPGGRLTVIMKATNICNIACTFCSVGPAGKDVMSDDDFEHLAQELERIIHTWRLRHLELTFHGGEPTAVGAEWINRACDRIRKLSVPVSFCMQTNLISFPDRMIEVAQNHEIRLGSSIDPLFAERIDIRGRDTYGRWVDNYRKLSALGFRIGAIFIVTKQAAARARELYRACEELNQYTDYPFGLQVQPVYEQGRADGAEDLLLSPEALGDFFVELYETWESSGRSISLTPINTFADAFEPRHGALGLQCAFGPGCATSHVGVDYALNVAGCGRRLDSDSIFGNLHEGHLDDIMLNSVEKRKLAQRYELLRNTECHDCRFFRMCHGGCPDDADLGYDDVSRKFYWCASYMKLYEAIEARAQKKYRRPVVASSFSGAAPASPAASSAESGSPNHEREPGPEPSTLVLASDRVSDVVGDHGSGDRLERWILPSAQGIDGDLAEVLDKPSDLIRLWVHNRQARDLRMWPDFVRDPRVRIVLFEPGEDLSIALNLSNALGCSVILDLQAICAGEASGKTLHATLERYLTDPLWKIQMSPFAQMLRSGLENVSTPWINRWGLVPGTFSAVLPLDRLDGLSPATREIVEQLRLEEATTPGKWLDEHRACGTCSVRSLCGGQLSARGGNLCSKAELAAVQRIEAETRAIILQLTEIGDKNRAASGSA